MINQYPVAAPCNSITFGITFFKCLMYLLHFAGVTVIQKILMPSTNSDLVLGFTSRRMYS